MSDIPPKPINAKEKDGKVEDLNQPTSVDANFILPPGKEPITLHDYINQINKHNDFLQAMLAVSLNDISHTQKNMHAQLSGAIKRAAERFAGLDPNLAQVELDTIGKYAHEYLGLNVEKGNSNP